MKQTIIKLFLLIFLLPTTSCGFKIINKTELNNFTIDEIKSTGDKRINYKIKNGNASVYLTNSLPKPIQTITEYNLHNSSNIRIPFCRTELYKRSFFPSTIILWNDLSLATCSSNTLCNFKKTTI